MCTQVSVKSDVIHDDDDDEYVPTHHGDVNKGASDNILE